MFERNEQLDGQDRTWPRITMTTLPAFDWIVYNIYKQLSSHMCFCLYMRRRAENYILCVAVKRGWNSRYQTPPNLEISSAKMLYFLLFVV